jgi:CHAT domain-containing protein
VKFINAFKSAATFTRLFLFSLFVLLSKGNFGQAGIDQWSPDDIFAPIHNQYYSAALSSLMSLDNNSNNALQPSDFTEFFNNIRRLYKIEGNYAGALDLLTGIPSPTYDPAYQFTNRPGFSMNLQEVIKRLKKSANTNLLESSLYNNLAEIYDQTGNRAKALDYLLASRQLLINSSAKDQYILTSFQLAEEYISANGEGPAEKILNEIKKETGDDKNSSFYISYLNLQALLYKKQNKLYAAIDVYNQIFTRLKINKEKHPKYYEMACNLGRLYTQTGQYKLADSVFSRNFHVLHQLGYKSVVFDQMGEGLCENWMFMDQPGEAAKKLISLGRWMLYMTEINSIGMSEDEEFNYANRLDEILNLLFTIVYNNPTANQSLMQDILFIELQRKSFVLLNKTDLRKQTTFYLKDGIMIPHSPLKEVKEVIAQQYSLPVSKRNLNIDSLEETSEKLERKISSKGFVLSPDDNSKSNVMDLATQPGTVNIEFVRFTYKSANQLKDSVIYAAFIFRQSFASGSFVPLCSEAQLLQLFKDKNGIKINEDQLSDKLYSTTSNYSAQLYNLLWAPMDPYLKGVTDVNYSAAGILNDISFVAIYTGKDYLMNVYSIHSFSSLSEASVYKTKYEKPVAVNVWGNMDYNVATYSNNARGPNYKPWPHSSIVKTDNQTKDIDTSLFEPFEDYKKNELKNAAYQNNIDFKSCELNYATEDSFKTAAASLNGVLHISTHGFYMHLDEKKAKELLPGNFMAANKNPLLRTGLAFSGVNYYWKKGIHYVGHDDGILTAYEIEQLDLHNIQLVTLSACETALGDSTYYEGNLGLPRAFKLAGVQYVLVSLWNVNAKVTADLLSLFYKNWFSGAPLSEALRNAQDAIRKEHPQPYFWASFVLIE